MNSRQPHLFEFGEFHLDTAERLLLRDGRPVRLPPKVFDTLTLLVEHSGHLLDKERLMRELWPDTFVEEVNLSVNISAIRKALGEREHDGRYVETVPKRGYRFTGQVRVLEDGDAEPILQPRNPAARSESPAAFAGQPATTAARGHADAVGTTVEPRPFVTSPMETVITSLLAFALGLTTAYWASSRSFGRVPVAVSQRGGETVVLPLEKGESRTALTKRRAKNPGTYEAYLQGRLFWNKRTRIGLTKAIKQFERAIALEPGYALAYSGLADAYTLLYDRNYVAAHRAAPQAKRAAARALELDDMLAEAHTSRAYVAWIFDRNGTEAEKEFRRAIALDPDYATARQWYGRYLSGDGRLDEALAELTQAQQNDPLSPAINFDLGVVLYNSRQYERAIAQFQKVLEMDPDFGQVHWNLGHAYERSGLYERAFGEYQKAAELLGGAAFAAELGNTYRTDGYQTALRALIADLKKEFDRRRGEEGSDTAQPTTSLVTNITRSYASLGEKGQALTWLQRATAQHRSWIDQLKVDPQFDDLRGDPRFVELLKRIPPSSG